MTSIAFSSLYEIVCGFTRDYDVIKNKILLLEEFDKTRIDTAFHAVNALVLEEWGSNVPCQVILVTDGCLGVGPTSLKNFLAGGKKREMGNQYPLPFPFPGQLHVVALLTPEELSSSNARCYYQKLVDAAGNEGSVIVPEGTLSLNSVAAAFQKLVDEVYAFKGVLKCGHLSSNIILSPPPVPYTKVTDFESKRMVLSKNIDVVGFISAADVSSPMAVSRHLILPTAGGSSANKSESDAMPQLGLKQEPESEGEEGNDDGKIPSFCVLLHGALKVENMVAMVTVGDEWFGYIYSHADCKKKSNLMLTVLPPGSDVVPWLGDLNNLGSAEFSSDADGDHHSHHHQQSQQQQQQQQQQPAAFPVRPNEKRSYSQNCVVWIRQVGLQSDIQKILRHARKLPEKTPQFYKELNRMRRAAIALGFMELLDGLAFIFERECSLLPPSAHPDCSLQLTHAVNELRKTHNRDIKFNISPMLTKYNTGNK